MDDGIAVKWWIDASFAVHTPRHEESHWWNHVTWKPVHILNVLKTMLPQYLELY
jgi:hypothetical protein